jgi:hypothetical protein
MLRRKIGKAFDRDAFLKLAREICTNNLGPVLGPSLSDTVAKL